MASSKGTWGGGGALSYVPPKPEALGPKPYKS